MAWWPAVSFAAAQESKTSVLVASLSVSTIQPEFMLTSVREQPDPAPKVAQRTDWPLPMRRHKPTDTEAWEKFESEFRPEQRSPSPVKRQIETAKYGLDTTVFAVDRFVKNVANHADFNLDQGHLRRTHADSPEESRDNPRVKLDLNMWLDGKPYVGMRIIIPVGN